MDSESKVVLLYNPIGNFYKDGEVVMSFKSDKGTYQEDNKKIVLYVTLTIIGLLLISSFFNYFTVIQYDYNILPDRIIMEHIETGKIAYWDYTSPNLQYNFLPRTLIIFIVGVIAMLSAIRGNQMIQEAIINTEKEPEDIRKKIPILYENYS